MNDLAEVFNSAIEKSDKCGQCGTITARIGGDSEAHWCCNCGAKLRGNHPYPTIADIPPRIWDDEKKQYKYLKVPVMSEVPMPEPKPDRVTQIGHGPRIYSHSPQQFKKWGESCRAAGYARAANWLRAKAEKHAEENGYHEPDTGSFVFASREAEEWNNSVLELADEMEVALRGEVK